MGDQGNPIEKCGGHREILNIEKCGGQREILIEKCGGPAEPPQKRQKFRIGWTRRAATKTAKSRELLVGWLVGCLLLPANGPEAPSGGKKSGFAGCCRCSLLTAQRPAEGGKSSEILDRLDPPSGRRVATKTAKSRDLLALVGWLVGCLRTAQRLPEGA